jgi:hypothetical protein
LLDTREGSGEGLLIGLLRRGGDLVPFVFAHTPEHNMAGTIPVAFGRWQRLAVRVDRDAETITFGVGDRTETVAFSGAAAPPFAGRATVGNTGFENSRVPGFSGEISHLTLGLEGGSAPELRLTVPADACVNIEADAPGEPGDRVAVGVADGDEVLRFTGAGSAGVELESHDRAAGDLVEVRLRARTMAGSRAALLTVGDANEIVQLAVSNGRAWLQCRDDRVGDWPWEAGAWHTIAVATGGGLTRVAVDGVWEQTAHDPQANWVYLGQGYSSGPVASSSAAVFDVATGSLRSRVLRAAE